jgi:argininosuccinate lyase
MLHFGAAMLTTYTHHGGAIPACIRYHALDVLRVLARAIDRRLDTLHRSRAKVLGAGNYIDGLVQGRLDCVNYEQNEPTGI